MRNMGAALVAAGLAVALFAACVPKYQPVRASSPTTAAVALVLDAEEDRTIQPVPDKLTELVRAELEARNLEPAEVPLERLSDGFARLRATPHRLAHLAEQAPDAEVLVLVEARTLYESQLEGSFRWTVSARITVARADARDLPSQADFEAPVFLRFQYEDAQDALTNAASAIAKRAGRVADELLAAMQQGVSVGQESRPEPPPPAAAERDAIYFVLVDRFADGLADAPGSTDPDDPQAFHGGDLPGLIAKLDDLQRLGIGAVWLSPVFAMRQDPVGEWGAFHGYWTQDLLAVEPRFGTERDLRRLSDELHRRGMKLYLDFVANHLANDHAFVKQRPDWFHGKGDVKDWDDPVQATTHDVHGLPDLAQDNPEVAEWLLGAARRWIEVARPDGFRLDAVRHVPIDFWARFNAEARAAGGQDFVLLGEMFDGDPAVLAEVAQRGGFSHLFDFPLHYAMVDTFCRGAAPGRLAAILSQDRLYPKGLTLVPFLDNHDLPRIASACEGDLGAVADALSFLFGARGTPSLTYGTEAALAGAHEPANRADMPWGERMPLRAHIERVAASRSMSPALREGRTRVLALEARRLVLQRATEDDVALVVVGAGKEGPLDLPPSLAEAVSAWEDAVSGERGAPDRLPALPGVALWIADGIDRAALALHLREQLLEDRHKKAVSFAVEGLPVGKGEHAYLIGAGPELGNWRPDAALGPLRRDGERFVADLAFPPGLVLEYKLIVRRPDGSVVWEDRPNRHLFTEPGRGELTVTATWGA